MNMTAWNMATHLSWHLILCYTSLLTIWSRLPSPLLIMRNSKLILRSENDDLLTCLASYLGKFLSCLFALILSDVPLLQKFNTKGEVKLCGCCLNLHPHPGATLIEIEEIILYQNWLYFEGGLGDKFQLPNFID